jgi:hypothetical protein
MSEIFVKRYLTLEGYQFVPEWWLDQVLREVQLAHTIRTDYFNIVSCETCPFCLAYVGMVASSVSASHVALLCGVFR